MTYQSSSVRSDTTMSVIGTWCARMPLLSATRTKEWNHKNPRSPRRPSTHNTPKRNPALRTCLFLLAFWCQNTEQGVCRARSWSFDGRRKRIWCNMRRKVSLSNLWRNGGHQAVNLEYNGIWIWAARMDWVNLWQKMERETPNWCVGRRGWEAT